MSRSRSIVGQVLFALGLLYSAGVFLVYWMVVEVALGGEIDRASAMSAVFIFLFCAPAAVGLMMLSSRFTSSRWPIRIVVAILTVPLILILAYFLTSAVLPLFSDG